MPTDVKFSAEGRYLPYGKKAADKLQEMQDWIDKGGAESMLKVKLKYQSSYTGNYKYDIDHTFDEIEAAIEGGQVVIAISESGEVYQLLTATTNIIKFFRAEYMAASGGSAAYVIVGRVSINKTQYTNRASVLSGNVNVAS